MEGTDDIPYKNSYFFVTTEPNWKGIFGKMQIINYIFKNPKAYLDWFIILKVIDAENPVVFWGNNLYSPFTVKLCIQT